MYQVSPEKLQEASELRKNGMGWRTIVGRTGISLYILRCNLEPGYKEADRAQTAISRARRRGGYIPKYLLKKRDMMRQCDPDGSNAFGHFAIGDRVMPVAVPQDAEEERQRANAYQHPTITAQVFGDPPPWRSALGKKLQWP